MKIVRESKKNIRFLPVQEVCLKKYTGLHHVDPEAARDAYKAGWTVYAKKDNPYRFRKEGFKC